MAFSVNVRHAGATAYEATNGSWRLTFDPSNASNPRAIELLLYSLGACTAATVGHYMERKGWPIEGLEVALSSDYDETAGRYVNLRINILLGRSLTEAHRKTLVSVARTCRIHKTLGDFQGIDITTSTGPD